MMLLSVQLFMRRNARMKHQATPPTLNALNGPRKSAMCQRSKLRSSHPSQDVLRSQGRCALPPDVGLKR